MATQVNTEGLLMHSPDSKLPNRSKTAEYESHNYAPYNSAVDNTLAQHRSVVQLLKSELYMNWSQIALMVLAAICLFSLTVALVYWLFFLNPGPVFNLDKEKSGREIGALAAAEPSKGFEIETSFTVFDTTPISTGEIVVTARSYLPSNLSVPSGQYCYITTSADIKGSETEIAYLDDQLEITTEDDFLIREAVPLCQFVIQK